MVLDPENPPSPDPTRKVALEFFSFGWGLADENNEAPAQPVITIRLSVAKPHVDPTSAQKLNTFSRLAWRRLAGKRLAIIINAVRHRTVFIAFSRSVMADIMFEGFTENGTPKTLAQCATLANALHARNFNLFKAIEGRAEDIEKARRDGTLVLDPAQGEIVTYNEGPTS